MNLSLFEMFCPDLLDSTEDWTLVLGYARQDLYSQPSLKRLNFFLRQKSHLSCPQVLNLPDSSWDYKQVPPGQLVCSQLLDLLMFLELMFSAVTLIRNGFSY